MRRRSTRFFQLIYFLSSFLLMQFAITQDQDQTVYTPVSASEAKFMSNAEASRRQPIALSGVVTCVPEGWKGFFLEDASGGIYCEPENTDAERSFWPVRVGEEIELKGVTAPGHRNSFVAVRSVTTRKPGNLPSQHFVPFETQLMIESTQISFVCADISLA